MPQGDAERMRIKALARWEGEGGALGRSGLRTDALDESELGNAARCDLASGRPLRHVNERRDGLDAVQHEFGLGKRKLLER